MNNVLLSQFSETYIGTSNSYINTTVEEYGHYIVPLSVRNAKYPSEFSLLPANQVAFAVIDDEGPLNLGDKIDYKDYIKIEDSNGSFHYVIVNPITTSQLANEARFRKLKTRENGIIIPPVNNSNARIPQTVNLVIPRISVDISQFSNEISIIVGNLQQTLSIPLIIPVIHDANGSYNYPNVQILAGTSVSFKLVTYENALRNGINLGAFLI